MDNNKHTLQEDYRNWGSELTRPIQAALGSIFAWAWRLSNDRQAVTSFLGRYSAHLGILTLVLLLAFFGKAAFAQVSEANVPELSLPSDVAAVPLSTPTPSGMGATYLGIETQMRQAVFRQALPHTEIPDRVRLEVITYPVQIGDTIFSIAEQFGISPYTLAWANRESLQDAPWLIQPGLPLYILPVDGVYHVVAAGETVESVADTFEVDAAALYNQWNDLRPGEALQEGQLLVIPGGVGPEMTWEAPPPAPAAGAIGSASYSSGFCGNTAVSGPGANGWFTLPTGSYSVSGWYFHDPGNPTHIGLDYTCHLGDPIYAADNGVVVFSGWGGGYGNLVQINHGNGYVTYYGHFDSIWVGCGESVYQGQVIGLCGTTGWSTGPHLHYEIRLNGVPQDPQLYEP